MSAPSSRTGQARTGPSRTGPLQAVLAELDAGTPTVDEVARRTGLDRGVVRAAVDFLVRSGRVSASPLSSACAGGCGTCADACPSRIAGSRPGDGRANREGRASRAGLVELRLRRREGSNRRED